MGWGSSAVSGHLPSYYVETNTSSRDWVIDIEGGGWCTTLDSCRTRQSRLSSSSTWAAAAAGSGITSEVQQDNPDYYQYNRVLFPYW